MKKGFIILAAAVLCSSAVFAAADRPVKVGELPQAAQTFLKTYFAKSEVAYAEMDDDVVKRDYEVVFRDGTKIEFDGKGEWKDIKCVGQSVPSALVPAQITSYVADNYPGESIVEIERGRYTTEVKLTNDLELEFNKRNELIKIDR